LFPVKDGREGEVTVRSLSARQALSPAAGHVPRRAPRGACARVLLPWTQRAATVGDVLRPSAMQLDAPMSRGSGMAGAWFADHEESGVGGLLGLRATLIFKPDVGGGRANPIYW